MFSTTSPFAVFEEIVIGLSLIGRLDHASVTVLFKAFAPMACDDWNASGLEDHDGCGVKEAAVLAYGASLPKIDRAVGLSDDYLDLVDVTFSAIVQQHGWRADSL